MTEEELVEKVAKAIYDQEYNYWGCPKWENAHLSLKLPMETAARAAIAAMREAGWVNLEYVPAPKIPQGWELDQ